MAVINQTRVSVKEAPTEVKNRRPLHQDFSDQNIVPPPIPRINAAAFGAPGRALASVGNALSQAGARFGAMEEKRLRFDLAKRYAEMEEKSNLAYIDAESETNEDYAGFHNNVMGKVKGLTTEFLKTVPERLRPEYEARIARHHTSKSTRAAYSEANGRRKYQTKSVTDFIVKRAELLAQNPTMENFESARENVENMVNSADLPKGMKPSIIKKSIEKLHQARLLGMSKTDPAGALKEAQRMADEAQKEAEGAAKAGASNAHKSGISQRGVDFIKRKEGYRAKAYWDVRQHSVGYGTRGKKGEVIDKAEAERRLRKEISEIDGYIRKNVKVPLTQGQRDALISFGYNLGSGSIGKLLPLLNKGDHGAVARKMLQYNKVRNGPGGSLQFHAGIDKRRREEARMYLENTSDKSYAPARIPNGADSTSGDHLKFLTRFMDKMQTHIQKAERKRADAQAIEDIASGRVKVSAYDSDLMRGYNQTFAGVLLPQTNLLKDEKAQALVKRLAANKAPFPKQVFEKLRGHIESADPEERAQAFELMSKLEYDNPGGFKAGKAATEMGKKLEQYRFFSQYYGKKAVNEMMLAEERRAKMTPDVLKAKRNEFLKKLSADDFGTEMEADQTWLEFFTLSDPDAGISLDQKNQMLREYKALALEEFNKTGNEDLAKASAFSMMKRIWGQTRVTQSGERTIMKFPPENFADPKDHDFIRKQFERVSKDAIETNRKSLEAQGYKIIGDVILRADKLTEISASAFYSGRMTKEEIAGLDGIYIEKEVPVSPVWRIHVKVSLNGEEGYLPLDNYFTIDGLGARAMQRMEEDIAAHEAARAKKQRAIDNPLPLEMGP